MTSESSALAILDARLAKLDALREQTREHDPSDAGGYSAVISDIMLNLRECRDEIARSLTFTAEEQSRLAEMITDPPAPTEKLVDAMRGLAAIPTDAPQVPSAPLSERIAAAILALPDDPSTEHTCSLRGWLEHCAATARRVADEAALPVAPASPGEPPEIVDESERPEWEAVARRRLADEMGATVPPYYEMHVVGASQLNDAPCPPEAFAWIRRQHVGWEDRIEVRCCLKISGHGSHSLLVIWAFGMNDKNEPTVYVVGVDEADETHKEIGNLVRMQSDPWSISTLVHLMCNATPDEVWTISKRVSK
jgi:hypothetical protein